MTVKKTKATAEDLIAPETPAEVTQEPAAGVTDPVTQTDPVTAEPRDWRGPGPFPAAFLMTGDRARRQSWAGGYELLAVEAGGRSGARLKLMTTGSRSGLVEWKPQHLADELMAQDWIVIPACELIP